MWNESQNSSEERKLELRLGPPGEEPINENMKSVNRERGESPLTLGYSTCHQQHSPHQAKAKASSFLQLSSSPQNMPVIRKNVSQPCGEDLLNAEKNTFSISSANTAVLNRSQKRTASGSVVGWPPIRSCRKNLASGSSSKPPSGSRQHQHHVVPDKVAGKKPVETSDKALFVKINMDGVPIGRKVDINAYNSYEKLSYAVDELFRGLLADSSAGGIHNKLQKVEEKGIMGSLIGSGEYTLVYEDNEGDRMLVQDVPWHIFVSTVKRLRVLKSSDQ
ncbi:auxin-responsive protein IAA26-like isoform X2 [Lotus japonicus]|uniref:auxin-responsive protein IAA26-like isoform X2 n=1 Tax=Lotus japonicus TaxID=34305 RepID=UPI002590C1BC|nr:auxin-responsive protein IAA26-like isoform X2 [Lotus japonicus]XP_057454419.1 auxin-responsive protein IAA26-like isoform X2 [Lotus japonicus]